MKKFIGWSLVAVGSVLGVAAVACILSIVLIPVGLVLFLMAVGFIMPGLAILGRPIRRKRKDEFSQYEVPPFEGMHPGWGPSFEERDNRYDR